MSIGCSGALKGCLHLTGEENAHCLAHYCFNGSNMTLNTYFSWCSVVKEGVYGSLKCRNCGYWRCMIYDNIA